MTPINTPDAAAWGQAGPKCGSREWCALWNGDGPAFGILWILCRVSDGIKHGNGNGEMGRVRFLKCFGAGIENSEGEEPQGESCVVTEPRLQGAVLCCCSGSTMPVGRRQAAISSGLHFSKILINNHLDRSGRYTVAACLFWGGCWRRHKDARYEDRPGCRSRQMDRTETGVRGGGRALARPPLPIAYVRPVKWQMGKCKWQMKWGTK